MSAATSADATAVVGSGAGVVVVVGGAVEVVVAGAAAAASAAIGATSPSSPATHTVRMGINTAKISFVEREDRRPPPSWYSMSALCPKNDAK